MKTALVTGAYKGLGLEWCRQLGKKGYTVILTARRLGKAQAAADELVKEGLTILPKAVDVAKEAQITNLAAEVGKEFGHLDVLVNNAGINSKDNPDELVVRKSTFLSELDPEEILKHISINSISPILMVKHFRKLLNKSDRPMVVSISSWLGSITTKDSMRGHYSYCTSKTALNMMNRAMSIELREEGIISIVVNPGWVQTDMGGQKADLTPEQSVGGLIENVLEKITIEDTGSFYQWNGTKHPW
ncbi:MAG: SDR family oxidoreductase [Acidobacteriota bacterium]|nr:SDR family oxidoreductase [Acidobacteriota bacterium]